MQSSVIEDAHGLVCVKLPKRCARCLTSFGSSSDGVGKKRVIHDVTSLSSLAEKVHSSGARLYQS